MAQSFTAADNDPLAESTDKRRRVLVTGAGGNIGTYFAQNTSKRYDLRLMLRDLDDKQQVKSLEKCGQIVTGDITDLETMKRLCEGIDTVLHLAADPSPEATWDSLLQANIIGAYNTFVAARSAGCRRVIYASSIHAVSGYPADVQVKTTDPVNPGDMYGVTKCFAEAMGRYMAEKESLSCIAIRIGAFQPPETARSDKGIAMLDAWVSRRDLNQLIIRSIDVEGLKFAILHGLSDNLFKRMDITDTRELVGYEPQDDLTDYHPKLKPLRLRERLSSHSMADPATKSGLREDLGPARARGKGNSKRAQSRR